jgi:2-polyprenyl-6-methoxyphenol hydroxylase-like FAD-dependent oxidoreductase
LQLLCDTDLDELWGNVGPCIGIERPRLQKILLTGAAAIPCRLGISVTSLFQWVKIDFWGRGRIVLIGDAAHAGPPTMAEGGCMAMEDAYVLAEVLRREETVESALESYVTRRRPRANWVQQQSRGVVESLLMPPSQRNTTFRERGNQGMHDRFGPLIQEP